MDLILQLLLLELPAMQLLPLLYHYMEAAAEKYRMEYGQLRGLVNQYGLQELKEKEYTLTIGIARNAAFTPALSLS